MLRSGSLHILANYKSPLIGRYKPMEKSVKYFPLLFISIGVSGCTTIHKDIKHVTNSVPTSELLVYRESGFMAGAVDALFGKNNMYFIELSNGEFGRFKIDSGKHTFQVDVDGAPEFELEITLLADSKACVKIESNPKLAGASLIPLVANLTPNFIMSEVPCSAISNLGEYKLVYGL